MPSNQPARKTVPKHILFGLGGTAVGLLIGILGTVAALTPVTAGENTDTAPSAAPAESRLTQANNRCGDSNPSATLGDDGLSLVLDGKGEDDRLGLSSAYIGCVLDAIDTPDSVTAQMDTTRALDGTRSDAWSNFEATWIYHPDDGINIILSESE